jgi:AcrR family transcriptional regulator
VYLRGFHGASIDNILRRAGVTKGAFFHPFVNKTEFGYCPLDEGAAVAEMITAQWVMTRNVATDSLIGRRNVSIPNRRKSGQPQQQTVSQPRLPLQSVARPTSPCLTNTSLVMTSEV